MVWSCRVSPTSTLPSIVHTTQATATYIDHCWLSDGRLVVATSQRQIFLLEANVVTEHHELGRGIVCMLPLPGNMLMVSMAKVWGGCVGGAVTEHHELGRCVMCKCAHLAFLSWGDIALTFHPSSRLALHRLACPAQGNLATYRCNKDQGSMLLKGLSSNPHAPPPPSSLRETSRRTAATRIKEQWR